MEVDAEPVLAQGGIVTPPANPGPEYSPDLASESSQDKQESTRVLPSFAAGPSKKEPLQEDRSSGLANAEVVASHLRPPSHVPHRQAPALMVVSLQRPRARPRKASLLSS